MNKREFKNLIKGLREEYRTKKRPNRIELMIRSISVITDVEIDDFFGYDNNITEYE